MARGHVMVARHMSQLGLPQDCVGLLVAANVVVCNPSVVFGELVRFVELSLFAKSEGALDGECLLAGT